MGRISSRNLGEFEGRPSAPNNMEWTKTLPLKLNLQYTQHYLGRLSLQLFINDEQDIAVALRIRKRSGGMTAVRYNYLSSVVVPSFIMLFVSGE